MNYSLVDIEFENIQHIHFLVHYRIDLVFQWHLYKINDVIQFECIRMISVR